MNNECLVRFGNKLKSCSENKLSCHTIGYAKFGNQCLVKRFEDNRLTFCYCLSILFSLIKLSFQCSKISKSSENLGTSLESKWFMPKKYSFESNDKTLGLKGSFILIYVIFVYSMQSYLIIFVFLCFLPCVHLAFIVLRILRSLKALKLYLQVLQMLEHLWGKKIIHGKIQWQNLMTEEVSFHFILIFIVSNSMHSSSKWS